MFISNWSLHCTLSQLYVMYNIHYCTVQYKKCHSDTDRAKCSSDLMTVHVYTPLLPLSDRYVALTLLDICPLGTGQARPGEEAFVHLTALAASGW